MYRMLVSAVLKLSYSNPNCNPANACVGSSKAAVMQLHSNAPKCPCV